MIRNFTDLTRATFARIEYFEETGGITFERAGTDAPTLFLRALHRRYRKAQHSAPNFGIIGVGAITFAERRMVRYQERLARKLA